MDTIINTNLINIQYQIVKNAEENNVKSPQVEINQADTREAIVTMNGKEILSYFSDKLTNEEINHVRRTVEEYRGKLIVTGATIEEK